MNPNKINLSEVDIYSENEMFERVKTRISANETVVIPPSANELCRIIHSHGRTFVSVAHKYADAVYSYLQKTISPQS